MNCNKTSQPISEFMKFKTHPHNKCADSVPIQEKKNQNDWNNGLYKLETYDTFLCVYPRLATADTYYKLSIQLHIWWPKYHSVAKVLWLDFIPTQLIPQWQQDGAPNLLDEILAAVKE